MKAFQTLQRMHWELLLAPVVLGSGKVVKPATNKPSSRNQCQGVTASDQGRS